MPGLGLGLGAGSLWKMLISTLVGAFGSYFLYRGKRYQEPKLMLWGGALIVLSFIMFS